MRITSAGRSFPAMRLEFRRLPLSELDGVGSGRDECVDGTAEVFDPVQEVTLAEEAVIDGYVEAAAEVALNRRLRR